MSEIRSQATPVRDELAEIIASRRGVTAKLNDIDRMMADRILDAGWSKPRTVTSAAELGAPAGNSVIFAGGVASIAHTDLNQPVRVRDVGHGAQCTTYRLTFPATVLFTPCDAG